MSALQKSRVQSPLWLAGQPLVLASQSTIRLRLLQASGLAVDVRKPDVDERAVDETLRSSGASSADIAMALAREKAQAVSRSTPGRLVVGADQTLDCEGRRFNKPGSRDMAAAQIAFLAGRTHHLNAGVALVRDQVVLFQTVTRAAMTMRRMQPDFIARYVAAAGAEVTSSVGAYQVEGVGIHLFERIEGDYFSILGLPLLPLLDALRRAGALAG